MDLTSIRKIAGLFEQEDHSKTKKVVLSEDLQSMFKIAGMIPLTEAYDSDDSDDDKDVKAADSEAKKRNIKLPDVADEKDEDDEDEKPKRVATNWGKVPTTAPKEKEAATEKPKAVKKVLAPGEVAKKGKPKNELSKSGVCRSYWRKHPEGSAKHAWEEMLKAGYIMKDSDGVKRDMEFTKAGWNTLCNKSKMEMKRERESGESVKIEEVYVIAHPHMNSFILHENRELNANQWISENEISALPPYMFESEQEATEYVKHLVDYQHMSCVVKRIQFDD